MIGQYLERSIRERYKRRNDTSYVRVPDQDGTAQLMSIKNPSRVSLLVIQLTKPTKLILTKIKLRIPINEYSIIYQNNYFGI